MEDAELLRRYLEEQAEPAFAALVQRHLPAVYAVALRKTGGEAALAQEAAQHVFTALARKARALQSHPALAAWLFTSTHFAATQLVRAERRRRVRETRAVAMNENTPESPEAQWGDVRPLLDDAVNALGERERQAIVLRFYEGCAWREVGARLQLTEDGARARVERSLEKLARMLARRGVRSTAEALSLALGGQAVASVPAGLATSIATSAVAGAGAAATLGAVSALGFMSTAKLTFTGLAALALALSLGTNAYLWSRPDRTDPPVAAPTPVAQVESAPPGALPLAALAADPAALRDRLRAAGASDTATRGVIEGILRQRYREKLSAQRAQQARDGWWRDAAWWFQSLGGDGPPPLRDDRALLRAMVLEPLEALFGPDPAEVAEREAKFAFLPTGKREAFIELDRAYDAAAGRLTDAEQNSFTGTELQRDRDARQRELLAALTPEERAEWELHFSATAVQLRERMDQIAATEAEFRAILPLVKRFGREESRALRVTPAEEHAALRQLVDVVGYDRALDYVWAGAPEYPAYARVAHEAGLPASTAARVLELAAETARRAMEIHAEAALSAEQRRAAIQALQPAVRAQLDAMLPPAVQQRLTARSLAWFTQLGSGSYAVIATTAAGTTGSLIVMGSGSVATPLQRSALARQFALPRPQPEAPSP
jgi:RNA polymerase sigma factor (sigma-70 family)